MLFELGTMAMFASKPLFLTIGSLGTVVLGGIGLSTYKKQINNPMKSWNSKQLANWVLKYGKEIGQKKTFSKYARNILTQDVSGQSFLLMSTDDCKELGMTQQHSQALLKRARGFA